MNNLKKFHFIILIRFEVPLHNETKQCYNIPQRNHSTSHYDGRKSTLRKPTIFIKQWFERGSRQSHYSFFQSSTEARLSSHFVIMSESNQGARWRCFWKSSLGNILCVTGARRGKVSCCCKYQGPSCLSSRATCWYPIFMKDFKISFIKNLLTQQYFSFTSLILKLLKEGLGWIFSWTTGESSQVRWRGLH